MSVSLTANQCVVELSTPDGQQATVVIGGAIGPVGPPGPAGPPGQSFDYTQSTPAATWTVNHNLGFRPDVAVFSTGGLVVFAQITHLTLNTTQIDFTAPFSGSAHFS